jgi:hypothetical protein
VDWAGTTTFDYGVNGNFVATNLTSGLTRTFTVDSVSEALYLTVVPEPMPLAHVNTYETWIRESLPATTTTPETVGSFDLDGDGQSNESEWMSLTHPANGSSRFNATPVRNGANLDITVPTAPGRSYTLLQSMNLQGGSWTAVPGIAPVAGTGSPHTFQIPIAAGSWFFEVRVSVP